MVIEDHYLNVDKCKILENDFNLRQLESPHGRVPDPLDQESLEHHSDSR